MIIVDEIKNSENFSHNLNITYPRTIQISYGVYDNVVDMMNMTTMISQNLDSSELTAVYGEKTAFGFFNNKPEFLRFITYVIQKHQNNNIFLNENNWYEKNIIFDSWGNKIKKGDHIEMHVHKDYHLILYLTEGAPLLLPEIKLKIVPQKGEYYLLPPFLMHGVEKVENDETRFSLVTNLEYKPNWNKKKLINDQKCKIKKT